MTDGWVKTRGGKLLLGPAAAVSTCDDDCAPEGLAADCNPVCDDDDAWSRCTDYLRVIISGAAGDCAVINKGAPGWLLSKDSPGEYSITDGTTAKVEVSLSGAGCRSVAIKAYRYDGGWIECLNDTATIGVNATCDTDTLGGITYTVGSVGIDDGLNSPILTFSGITLCGTCLDVEVVGKRALFTGMDSPNQSIQTYRHIAPDFAPNNYCRAHSKNGENAAAGTYEEHDAGDCSGAHVDDDIDYIAAQVQWNPPGNTWSVWGFYGITGGASYQVFHGEGSSWPISNDYEAGDCGTALDYPIGYGGSVSHDSA